ncbi:MAG: DUF120 domain-containing protein [Nanoarchaeota archaeon]
MHRTLLIHLAKHGLFCPIKATTKEFAKEVGISQQSVSRHLNIMARESLITLTATPSGFTARLTEEGIAFLRNDLAELQSLFRPKKELPGTVFSGLGEGSYYIARYSARIKEAFGFSPSPGTLNLRVDAEQLRHFLLDKDIVRIQGFKERGRAFGPVDGIPAKINGMKGVILLPQRTSHPKGSIEFSAPINLRKKLGLKDNDRVRITGDEIR